MSYNGSMSEKGAYIAIDLKSFYASVECRERGLDPLTARLVVADESRTEKTICLAVSPALKAFGIPGRARLFEVVQRVKEVNRERRARGEAEIDFIAARPRMALYMEYSARIYDVYLQFIAPEDIHVYSVDEVMIDASPYLKTYGMTPRQLAKKLVQEVYSKTGITATAGIGTNLYLCKVAMDIGAKHVDADEDGVRIAQLDEKSYREQLWNHRPLTDFWRVGRGTARKLEENGLYTMGDVARCSLGRPGEFHNEELLYRLFGVNAELLIDHAWGWEPCGIADVKAYKPKDSSLTSGQVLEGPYSFDKARVIAREMADLMSMGLVRKGLVADQMVLTVGYDIDNLRDPERAKRYHGPLETDYYGRTVPKSAHGSQNMGGFTSSTEEVVNAILSIYDRTVNPDLFVRRMYVVANHVKEAAPEASAEKEVRYEQLSLFDDHEEEEQEKARREEQRAKERRIQEAMLEIRERYGGNAILKGTDLQEGATARERNQQIGGHRA